MRELVKLILSINIFDILLDAVPIVLKLHHRFYTVWLGLTHISEFVTIFARSQNITYCNYRISVCSFYF